VFIENSDRSLDVWRI